MRKLTLASALAIGLMPIAANAADDALIEAAKKEGQVTWYTTMVVEQAHRSIGEAFEKKYGIKVLRSRGDDAANALKILNEARARNPQADIFDGFSAIPALRKADLMAKFLPPTANAYPPEAKDADGYWTGVNMTVYVPAANTKLIPREKAPKTYQDLLDPSLKGKMVWNPTNSVAAPLFVGQILRHMGQEKGMEYLRALSGQQISRLETSARAILDRVIAGDYALGIMMSEAHAVTSAQAGAPVEWLKVEPAIVTIVGASLIKDAPRPNAGKLLIEFITSEEGQSILRDNTYVPALPSVTPTPPTITPKQGGFNAVYVNGNIVGEHLDEWMKVTNALFR